MLGGAGERTHAASPHFVPGLPKCAPLCMALCGALRRPQPACAPCCVRSLIPCCDLLTCPAAPSDVLCFPPFPLGYWAYQHRIRSIMQQEVRAIMAQYMVSPSPLGRGCMFLSKLRLEPGAGGALGAQPRLVQRRGGAGRAGPPYQTHCPWCAPAAAGGRGPRRRLCGPGRPAQGAGRRWWEQRRRSQRRRVAAEGRLRRPWRCASGLNSPPPSCSTHCACMYTSRFSPFSPPFTYPLFACAPLSLSPLTRSGFMNATVTRDTNPSPSRQCEHSLLPVPLEVFSCHHMWGGADSWAHACGCAWVETEASAAAA